MRTILSLGITYAKKCVNIIQESLNNSKVSNGLHHGGHGNDNDNVTEK